MLDLDSDAAWASWDNDRILRWAERRGYRQMGPIVKVRLMTIGPDEPDEAWLYFKQWRAERHHSNLPSPSPSDDQHSDTPRSR